MIEGVVLSSVYWGWLFAALLADPLIDRYTWITWQDLCMREKKRGKGINVCRFHTSDAEILIDSYSTVISLCRVGVRVVLSVSVGVVGLLGLLTHAASLGGPWTLLGFRVVQGTVQVG